MKSTITVSVALILFSAIFLLLCSTTTAAQIIGVLLLLLSYLSSFTKLGRKFWVNLYRQNLRFLRAFRIEE